MLCIIISCIDSRFKHLYVRKEIVQCYRHLRQLYSECSKLPISCLTLKIFWKWLTLKLNWRTFKTKNNSLIKNGFSCTKSFQTSLHFNFEMLDLSIFRTRVKIFGFFKIHLYWSYIGPTFPRVNISIIQNLKVGNEGRIILLGRRLLWNSIRNLRDVFSWVTIVSGYFVTLGIHGRTFRYTFQDLS